MRKLITTLLLSAAALVSCGVATSANIPYRYLGRINTPSPAFVKVEQVPGQEEFLLISEFGALSSGSVSVIPKIRSAVNSKSLDKVKTQVLSNNFKWPNSVSIIPQDVFPGSAQYVVVPDGFLPPGKTNGNIYVMALADGDVTKQTQLIQLSSQKPGFFYHTGYWVDIDGDGMKDYITARTNAQAGSGELVWYKNPAQGLKQTPWQEQVLTKGPDVMFEVFENIQGYENSLIVFAAEFFNKKLTAYQIQLGTGNLLASKVIDNQLDQAYSVNYVDINNDGKMKLLVNNHESDNSKAAIFLYDVPSDLFNENYGKKVIASGFKNAFSLLIPNMCPGFPYVVNIKNALPHILVAGDGDYSAHLMRPDGAGNFNRETIKNLGGTVGSIAVYDFDNDGFPEFFVPNYDKSYIEVYQFYSGQSQSTSTDNDKIIEDDISFEEEEHIFNPTEFLH